MGRHALDASTNSDLNHTRFNGVSNIDTGHEAARALTVQRANSGRGGEAGNERCGAHLGGAATRSKNGANGNILNKGWVDLGAGEDPSEGTGHQVGGSRIFETTFATLGESGTKAGSDNNLAIDKR